MHGLVPGGICLQQILRTYCTLCTVLYSIAYSYYLSVCLLLLIHLETETVGAVYRSAAEARAPNK